MKPTLAYDADCGPCSTFARMVSVLDIHCLLDFSSIRHAEAEGLLIDMPRSLRYMSFHLILSNGEVRSGAQGIPYLLGYFPFGKLLKELASERGMFATLSFAYRALSRKHASSSCGVPTTPTVLALDNAEKRIRTHFGGAIP